MTLHTQAPPHSPRPRLAVATLLLSLMAACSDGPDDSKEPQPQNIAVVVRAATTGPVTAKINTTGTVMAEHQTTISAETGGRVLGLPVQLGSVVEKGGLLAHLDPTVAKAQVQQAAASLLQARARLDLAAANLARTEGLHRSSAASDQAMEQARMERDSRAAAVKAAEAGLQLANKSLGDCSLRAPFTGTVSKVQLELGALVAAGTPAFELVSADKLFVLSAVASGAIAYLSEGIPVLLRAPSLPDAVFSARIARLGPSADVTTRTYPIEISLNEDGSALRPGMMTRVEIILERRQDAVLIPRASVIGEAQSTIYVIDAGIAHQRQVEIGLTVGNLVEIRAGLRAGELVVSLGQQKLHDGAEVRIYDMPELPSAAQPAQAAAAAAHSNAPQ